MQPIQFCLRQFCYAVLYTWCSNDAHLWEKDSSRLVQLQYFILRFSLCGDRRKKKYLVLVDIEASQYLIGRRIETAIYHWLLDLAGAGPRPLRCNSTEWRFLAFLLLLPLVRTYCSAQFIILSECFPIFDVQYVYYFYHNLLDKIMVTSGSWHSTSFYIILRVLGSFNQAFSSFFSEAK